MIRGAHTVAKQMGIPQLTELMAAQARKIEVEWFDKLKEARQGLIQRFAGARFGSRAPSVDDQVAWAQELEIFYKPDLDGLRAFVAMTNNQERLISLLDPALNANQVTRKAAVDELRRLMAFTGAAADLDRRNMLENAWHVRFVQEQLAERIRHLPRGQVVSLEDQIEVAKRLEAFYGHEIRGLVGLIKRHGDPELYGSYIKTAVGEASKTSKGAIQEMKGFVEADRLGFQPDRAQVQGMYKSADYPKGKKHDGILTKNGEKCWSETKNVNAVGQLIQTLDGKLDVAKGIKGVNCLMVMLHPGKRTKSALDHLTDGELKGIVCATVRAAVGVHIFDGSLGGEWANGQWLGTERLDAARGSCATMGSP